MDSNLSALQPIEREAIEYDAAACDGTGNHDAADATREILNATAVAELPRLRGASVSRRGGQPRQ